MPDLTRVRSTLDELRAYVAQFRTEHDPQCSCEWDRGAMWVIDAIDAVTEKNPDMSEPEILWQYGMPDGDEPDGMMTFDGTPRILTPRMVRRPLVPAGPWEPALRIAPECSTSHPRLHADCDGCDCRCHATTEE